MFAVFEKELKSYFFGASGYVFMGVFLLISGIFFANDNILAGNTNFSNVLSDITFIFLILVPIITMKLLAEERNQKTDQLLLTSPAGVWQIIIGKYLAAVALFIITLSITSIYPIILNLYSRVSFSEVFTNYIGFILLGAVFISIGLYISSLTDNQATAGTACFGSLLLIWMMELVQPGLPDGRNAGFVFVCFLISAAALMTYTITKNLIASSFAALILGIASAVLFIRNSLLFEGFIPRFLGCFSLLKKYELFTVGIIDLSAVIYYITFSVFFVYLTASSIEKRRWS